MNQLRLVGKLRKHGELQKRQGGSGFQDAGLGLQI